MKKRARLSAADAAAVLSLGNEGGVTGSSDQIFLLRSETVDGDTASIRITLLSAPGIGVFSVVMVASSRSC